LVPCHAQVSNTKKQILELKKGVLLIRLSTRERTVDDLKKLGKTRAAEEIRNEQERKNKIIIEAFKANFNFCEYRFFYSQYSSEILNRNFKFLIFDKNLTPDADFSLNGQNFYMAEFAVLQPDTIAIAREKKLVFEKDFSAEEKNVYYQNAPNKIFALVIKDNNFIQLKYPFPYYVNGNNTARAVKRLNSKLNNYYKKNFPSIQK
jgi:hypothetical protein